MRTVLTGEVHTGKTTVCRAVVHLARQRGWCVRGILTPPILGTDGQRLGVAVVDLESGEQRTLAQCRTAVGSEATSATWSGPQVGDYDFDAGAVEWGQDVVLRAIGATYDLLMIDEIGRLELEQGIGFHQVLDALAARSAPRNVTQRRAGHILLVVRKPLLATLRQRLPSFRHLTFEVTVDNRDTLAREIIGRLFPQ
jgi:nucleoside-triphosphatase THEP1